MTLLCTKKGRSNVLEAGYLAKDKGVVTGTCMAGRVVFRRGVIAIVMGVVKANCLSRLKGYEGHLALTQGCAKNAITSIK